MKQHPRTSLRDIRVSSLRLTLRSMAELLSIDYGFLGQLERGQAHGSPRLRRYVCALAADAWKLPHDPQTYAALEAALFEETT